MQETSALKEFRKKDLRRRKLIQSDLPSIKLCLYSSMWKQTFILESRNRARTSGNHKGVHRVSSPVLICSYINPCRITLLMESRNRIRTRITTLKTLS